MKKYIFSAKTSDVETVIFRKGYDPYTEQDEYIVLFPDDPTNGNTVAGISMERDQYDNKWVFYPYDEYDYRYLMSKTKIIHKNDPIISELVTAFEQMYDMKVRVTERIQYRPLV